jgi:hypothetical protein
MTDKKIVCSWCDRSSDDVKYILAGSGVAVCDECLSELSIILAADHNDWRDPQIERLSQLRQAKG